MHNTDMAPKSACIVGAAMTALLRSQPLTPVELMVAALQSAVCDAALSLQDIDTLITLPSLMGDQFMVGHAVAQAVRVGAPELLQSCAAC
jgi:acetyl-CoA acetyltransferase